MRKPIKSIRSKPYTNGSMHAVLGKCVVDASNVRNNYLSRLILLHLLLLWKFKMKLLKHRHTIKTSHKIASHFTHMHHV